MVCTGTLNNMHTYISVLHNGFFGEQTASICGNMYHFLFSANRSSKKRSTTRKKNQQQAHSHRLPECCARADMIEHVWFADFTGEWVCEYASQRHPSTCETSKKNGVKENKRRISCARCAVWNVCLLLELGADRKCRALGYVDAMPYIMAAGPLFH